MRWPWQKKMRRPEPRGDPEGVQQAETILSEAQRRLDRDRRSVVEPLRREAYKNNIQELVESLLRGNRGSRGPGTDTH